MPLLASRQTARVAAGRLLQRQTSCLLSGKGDVTCSSGLAKHKHPPSFPQHRAFSSTTPPPNPAKQDPYLSTNGLAPPVWTHSVPLPLPFSFPPPTTPHITTPICIVGAGATGLHAAYELVSRGHAVTMLEARDVLSGESGRMEGGVSNLVVGGYHGLRERLGGETAGVVAEGLTWARERVWEVAGTVGAAGARRVYEVVFGEDVAGLKEEEAVMAALELDGRLEDNLAIPGWTDQPPLHGLVSPNQLALHPTRYLTALLTWLTTQPNFQCFTHTRATSITENPISLLTPTHPALTITTSIPTTIHATHAIEATSIPLQKLSIISTLTSLRTYHLALPLPHPSTPDLLLHTPSPFPISLSLTPRSPSSSYLLVSGSPHPVGQDPSTPHFLSLEEWARARVPSAGPTEYAWSSQSVMSPDGVGIVGRNPGSHRVYVATGDCGGRMVYAALAGRVLADEIEGRENGWAGVLSPARDGGLVKSFPGMVKHDVRINLGYERFVGGDVGEVEDLGRGEGGVLHAATSRPLAIYKDEEGKLHKYSALCPHMQGVVCWNAAEKTFDCPVHGSRFSREGLCLSGPAKEDLKPIDKTPGKEDDEYASGSGM